jgi:hypothetical protein
LTSGAAAGPLHPAFGAWTATNRGYKNIALEGFSEDDNQDGFVDPIGQAAVVAPVAYAAHYPYLHHAVAPLVKVEAPKVEKVEVKAPIVTYAAPHVYTGHHVVTHPVTYTHTVPAGVLTHAPFYGGFLPGLVAAAPAKAEDSAITEA